MKTKKKLRFISITLTFLMVVLLVMPASTTMSADQPMINLGTKETMQMRDGWTIKTADGKPSAHFEYAVAVDKGKADVLTTFKYIEEVLNKR